MPKGTTYNELLNSANNLTAQSGWQDSVKRAMTPADGQPFSLAEAGYQLGIVTDRDSPAYRYLDSWPAVHQQLLQHALLVAADNSRDVRFTWDDDTGFNLDVSVSNDGSPIQISIRSPHP